MKIIIVAAAVVLSAFQFGSRAYALELCDSQDYYNLEHAAQCSIQYKSAGAKGSPQDTMFEIMKNYPYDQKEAFVKLLQRKVDLVDTYTAQRKGLARTGKTADAVSRLERAKQVLLGQVTLVNGATRENWVSVRDQARKALEDTTKDLRDIE